MDRPFSGGRVTSTHGRVVAASLSFMISVVLVRQFVVTFDRSWTLGVGVMTLTGVSFLFGVALLARPWRVDELGRDRIDTRDQERIWYAGGIAINLMLLALFAGAHAPVLSGFGIGERLGHVAFSVELISVALSVLVIVALTVLVRVNQRHYVE